MGTERGREERERNGQSQAVRPRTILVVVQGQSDPAVETFLAECPCLKLLTCKQIIASL